MSFKLSIGRVAIAAYPLYTNEAIAAFYPKQANVEPEFLFYALPSAAMSVEADQAVKGQTLNKAKLLDLPLHLPPLPEQRKIAAILSSVDDTTEKTQAVIDQLEVVRKGLLGELLTRGMPGRHRKQKETEAGPVPESWDLAKGEELFKLAGGYGPSSLQLDENGECLFLKVDDMNLPENRINIGAAALRFQAKLNPNIRIYSAGSIIFAKRGAAISKNRVRVLGCSATVDPNLMVLIPGPRLNAHFFRLLLEHVGLPNLADNSGIPQLNNKHLYPHLFAVPSLREQEEIVTLIDSIELRQGTEYSYLRTVIETKKCLSEALLTGKLRTSTQQEAA